MKLLTGLNMLFAIWLLVLACIANGDTSAVSIMDQPSTCQQSVHIALNSPVTVINNVSSTAGITSVSFTRCLNDTVDATLLVVPVHLDGHLTPSVKLSHGACHSRNSTCINSSGLALDAEPTLRDFEASHASNPEGSPTEDFERRAKNNHLASSISSQASQALPRCGGTSTPIESQVQSAPTLTPDPTAIPSHPASKISASIIPRAEEVTPAPATNKSLIIGVVFGTFFGLLLIICVAAACCTATVRRKTWFWRRPEDRVRDGLPRCAACDGPVTTFGLGDGISNASSDTLFEAYGVRPGQYPRNVRLSGRNTQRGRRDSDSYELQDLRALAGYSTGGYLSAV